MCLRPRLQVPKAKSSPLKRLFPTSTSLLFPAASSSLQSSTFALDAGAPAARKAEGINGGMKRSHPPQPILAASIDAEKTFYLDAKSRCEHCGETCIFETTNEGGVEERTCTSCGVVSPHVAIAADVAR